MSRRSIFWPIALIIAVVVPLALILTDVTPAAPLFILPINGCPTDGPANTPPYPAYPQCELTRIALVKQTEGTDAYPNATSTNTAAAAATSAPASSGSTATPTPTATSTGTRGPAATAAPSATPRATATAGAAISVTPTSVLPPDVTAIACIPGETIVLEGSAAPGLALIALFDQRPVGGGFSDAGGTYRLRLRIGDERPGTYLIQVEERSGRTVVGRFGCEVPFLTPTPTPPLIPNV